MSPAISSSSNPQTSGAPPCRKRTPQQLAQTDGRHVQRESHTRRRAQLRLGCRGPNAPRCRGRLVFPRSSNLLGSILAHFSVGQKEYRRAVPLVRWECTVLGFQRHTEAPKVSFLALLLRSHSKLQSFLGIMWQRTKPNDEGQIMAGAHVIHVRWLVVVGALVVGPTANCEPIRLACEGAMRANEPRLDRLDKIPHVPCD